MPQLGDNAIYRMAKVLRALEDYAANVAPTLGSHRLVGHPTLSVGIITGGISVNTVPDQCTIEIDRRVLPGEDAKEARRLIVDYVTAAVGEDPLVEHESPFIITNGLDDRINSKFATRVGVVAQEQGGAGQLTGVPYGTDAPAFDAIGAPTVVFGPGSIDQAHTCDEWVSIDQLERAAETYYHFARDF